MKIYKNRILDEWKQVVGYLGMSIIETVLFGFCLPFIGIRLDYWYIILLIQLFNVFIGMFYLCFLSCTLSVHDDRILTPVPSHVSLRRISKVLPDN